MSTEVLIVSNGPGELSAWVRPVVRRLRAELPGARITVALVPCPYASGQEAATVAAWPDAPAVWTPRETLRYLAFGRRPDNVPAAGQRGCVLFLGGDQLFAALLGRRTGWPVLVYTDGAARWRPLVSRFFAADRATHQRLAKRLGPERLKLAGNLMVDAVAPGGEPALTREGLGLRADAQVLGLLPGSKPFKVRWVTPLFLRVAEILQERQPNLQLILHRSPFTPREQLRDAVENPTWASATGGTSGQLDPGPDGLDRITTPGGAEIRVLPPEAHYHGMAIADLALTVPGTNTAELAILGVPMVVALPLHKPEAIPLDGLLGRIGSTPGVGAPLMRFLARRFEARRPLVALPNQRAGRMVTPELLGAFSPEALADEVEQLLVDPIGRRDVKLALHDVMGGPGAAGVLAGAIREVLGGAPDLAMRSGSS